MSSEPKPPILAGKDHAAVTNRMAVDAGDFDKGEADGAHASLRVIGAVVRAWRRRRGGER